jgi:hypothetical protein
MHVLVRRFAKAEPVFVPKMQPFAMASARISKQTAPTVVHVTASAQTTRFATTGNVSCSNAQQARRDATWEAETRVASIHRLTLSIVVDVGKNAPKEATA